MNTSINHTTIPTDLCGEIEVTPPLISRQKHQRYKTLTKARTKIQKRSVLQRHPALTLVYPHGRHNAREPVLVPSDMLRVNNRIGHFLALSMRRVALAFLIYNYLNGSTRCSLGGLCMLARVRVLLWILSKVR